MLQNNNRRLRRDVKNKVRVALGLLSTTCLIGYVWYSRVYNPEVSEPRRRLQDAALTREKNNYPTDFFTDETLKNGAFLFHFFGMLYMFVAIAIVCDEFFVPALERIVDTLEIPHDVAGATFMAAGGSAPELFTNFVGVFISESNVGFGTVVGSAVFNVLFVIGMCAIFSSGELKLTWWPFARDVTYYCFTLITLGIFFGGVSKNFIELWEAIILFCLYFGYVTLMYFNNKLHNWFFTKILKKTGEPAVPIEKQTRLITFRVGLMKLMTSEGKTWIDLVGAYIVDKIAGSIDAAFDAIDSDSNGQLDRDEIRGALRRLGIENHETLDEDLDALFASADVDGDGEISKEEFRKWYMTTKSATRNRVATLFKRYDTDNNGYIDENEFDGLLKAITGKDKISDELKRNALTDMCKGQPDPQGISREVFTDWYNEQMFKNHLNRATRRESRQGSMEPDAALRAPDTEEDLSEAAGGGIGEFGRRLSINKDGGEIVLTGDEEDDDVEPISLAFPKNGGCGAKLWWAFTIPLLLPLWLTLPDVRNPKYRNWFPYTFIASILWLGFFSYLMVWWATIVGWCWAIPTQVMGLTFIAAGTSVPDLLTSVIVARQGHGDMAVSSSIGSNIFDVTVCLPLPWLLKILSSDDFADYTVESDSLVISIIVLFAMVLAVFLTIVYNKWVLTKGLGYTMFCLYGLFVLQDLFTYYGVWAKF